MFDPTISTHAELKDLTKEQENKAVIHTESEKSDNAPWPVGGWAAVGKNLTLPSYAKGVRVKGRVRYEFSLDPQGKVTKVTILNGVNADVDAAVEHAIYSTPFHPAVRNGQAVGIRLQHYIDISIPN